MTPGTSREKRAPTSDIRRVHEETRVEDVGDRLRADVRPAIQRYQRDHILQRDDFQADRRRSRSLDADGGVRGGPGDRLRYSCCDDRPS